MGKVFSHTVCAFNDVDPLAVSFRKATVKDKNKVFDIHVRSVKLLCSPYYSKSTIEGWFDDRTPDYYLPSLKAEQIFIACLGKQEIGFVEAVAGEITGLFVLPEAAGKGVGKALLKIGLEMALNGAVRKVRIEATLNAVGFYRKSGFVEIASGEWTSPTGKIHIPVMFMEYRRSA
jgi:GNAT superfamily N-acetyltransferase